MTSSALSQAKTDDALVVRIPGGLSNRYRKTDVISQSPLKSSLMPSGLHQGLREQQLVDLIEYLTTLEREEK